MGLVPAAAHSPTSSAPGAGADMPASLLAIEVQRENSRNLPSGRASRQRLTSADPDRRSAHQTAPSSIT